MRAIRLIDGNNWIHVKVDQSLTGQIAREVFYETLNFCDLDVVIWTFDAPDARQLRQTIFPDYKAQREATGENIKANLDLVKQVLTFTPAIQVEVPRFEADDVIAEIVRRYQDQTKITIFSTDGDLLQLTQHPNVFQTRAPYEQAKPEEVRLYKTLVGDKSDNIGGIHGFGEVAWKVCNRKAFLTLLNGESPLRYPIEDWLGVKPKQAEWIANHLDTLRSFWEITGFFSIPDVNDYLRPGTSNIPAAEELLKEFLQ